MVYISAVLKEAIFVMFCTAKHLKYMLKCYADKNGLTPVMSHFTDITQ